MILLFMFSWILLLVGFSITPETVVTTIIGGLVSYGFTNLFKGWTGAMRLLAVALTYTVCFVVAIGATIGIAYYNGQDVTVNAIVSQSFGIFTLATFAYRLIPQSNES